VIAVCTLLDRDKCNLELANNKIKIISTEAIPKLFATTFREVAQRLGDYVEGSNQDNKRESKRVDIPATGNEKDILSKVKRNLNLPNEISFIEAFKKFSEMLECANEEKFNAFVNGEKIHSPLSIFKPELYSLTRGPFFDGMLKSDSILNEEAKLSSWDFMLRLGGFIISRTGLAKIQSGSNVTYLSVLILPVDVNYSQAQYKLLLNHFNSFPGFNPMEGTIMWMALELPAYVTNVFVVGLANPFGSNPASVKIGFHVPLSEYRNRATSFLHAVEKKGLEATLKYVVWAGMKEKVDTERELLKLLFLASQQDPRSIHEFILRSSRHITNISNSKTVTKDTLLHNYCKNLIRLVPAIIDM